MSQANPSREDFVLFLELPLVLERERPREPDLQRLCVYSQCVCVQCVRARLVCERAFVGEILKTRLHVCVCVCVCVSVCV